MVKRCWSFGMCPIQCPRGNKLEFGKLGGIERSRKVVVKPEMEWNGTAYVLALCQRLLCVVEEGKENDISTREGNQQ